MRIAHRLPLCQYLEMRRLDEINPPPFKVCPQTISTSLCVQRISVAGCREPVEATRLLDLPDALGRLCSCFPAKATVRHCRYLIATLDGVFFRGLVYSMLNGEQDSAAQTAAVDLLRLICRHLHLSIQEVISKQPLTLADENTSRVYFSCYECVVREAAFALFTVISSANVDVLTCSAMWAIVNLVRVSNLLMASSRLVSIVNVQWIRRMMLEDHLVQALDLQLRPVDRLTKMLRHRDQGIDFQELEDLDFDSLLPIFAVLAILPDHTSSGTCRSRLLAHLNSFASFAENLFSFVLRKSDSETAFLSFIASTVLPVFHLFLKSLLNVSDFLKPQIFPILRLSIQHLDAITFPGHESVGVIACLTRFLRLFSSSGAIHWICFGQSDFQEDCANTVIKISCSLRKRIDWSVFGAATLSDVKTFMANVKCQISTCLLEKFIQECIFSAYGDCSAQACEAAGAVVTNRPGVPMNLIQALGDWLRHIIRLCLLPEGVEIQRPARYRLELTDAILGFGAIILKQGFWDEKHALRDCLSALGRLLQQDLLLSPI